VNELIAKEAVICMSFCNASAQVRCICTWGYSCAGLS